MTACKSLCNVCRRPQVLTTSLSRGYRYGRIQPHNTIQQHPRRYFSSSRKRQRPRELSLTKRERIRLHKERPKEDLKGIFVSRQEAGQVLESRLTEARKFVYNFWSGGGDGPRPPRQGPTMDGRWWFWNICLALTPATIIGLYCEFFVEDEMKEFFRNMDEAQQRRIMGDEYVEEEATARQEPIAVEQQGFGQKAKQAVRELADLSSASEPKPSDGSHSEQPPTTNEELVEERNEGVTKDSGNVNQAEISRPPVNDRDLLLSLRHRIDALEKELEKNQRRQDQRRTYQMERMQQSGIQNRVEDRMVQEWEAKRQQQVPSEETAMDADGNDKTLSEKMREAAWVGLRQNIGDKKEAMERYGMDIMDRAWGFWEEKDENGGATLNKEGSTKDSSIVQSDQDATTLPVHDEVVKKVQETAEAVQEAADTVASSVSSDPSTASQTAMQAAEAARLAAESARLAAEPASIQSSAEHSWWRRVFQIKHPKDGEPAQEDEPGPTS